MTTENLSCDKECEMCELPTAAIHLVFAFYLLAQLERNSGLNAFILTHKASLISHPANRHTSMILNSLEI